MSRLSKALLLPLAVAFSAISAALPQTSTGTILGTVTDQSGGVLPGAKITVHNQGTNVARTVTTTNLGAYRFSLLPPGVYAVTAETPEFGKYERSGIDLQVNEWARVDVRLQVGDPTFSVQVVGDAPMVEADSATLGSVVDQHKVVELPLNGRDFYQLTYLVPGATPGAEGGQLSTQGGSVSVNGMRAQSNNFLWDGVGNNNLGINQVALPPPVDSIQEFKVQSGLYGAEYGTRAGAQINFVTRSGTNRFHGSLYEFHRNAVLDARNFFDAPDLKTPHFVRNQYGFSVGGPIIRDKTFFFGNFEGLRERKAITRLATVPSTSLIEGDFSGIPRQLTNPSTGEPFPGNIIPPSAMDPIGSAIANFYPAPNSDSPGGNFLAQPISKSDVDQFVVRLDHQTGEGDSLFGRYAYWHSDRFEAYDALVDLTNLPVFGTRVPDRGHNLALGWTRPLTSSLLNDFRFGFSRNILARFHQSQGNDISSQLGIRGLSTDPLVVGFPATQVVGLDSLAEAFNLPQRTTGNTLQFLEGLSWIRGRHHFKLGTDLQRTRGGGFLRAASRGLFIYTGQASGHPLSDLLLGSPSVVLRGPEGSSLSQSTWSYSFYFQGDFKWANNLTLSYGLRYEYHQPAVEAQDRFHVPDLSAPTPTFIRCGTQGIPRGCMESDRNNFAPRLGLAWAPTASGNTVIRGGYGIFYSNAFANFSGGPIQNPPNPGIEFFFSRPLSDPFSGRGLDTRLAVSPDGIFRQPYAEHWSLNLQQGFGDHYLIEVGYVGTRGRNLLALFNRNQPEPGGGKRPFPNYGPLNARGAVASSDYHGLQIRAEKRFQGGLSFLGSYTLSKSLDDSSALFGSTGSDSYPQNSQDRVAERGLSAFDNRHRFVFNYIWELPIGRGKKLGAGLGRVGQAVFGNWQLTGIMALQSSRPFTPLLEGTNDSRTDNGRGIGTDRPNLVGNPHLSNPDPAQWVNASAFERTAQGTFGNAGRNILQGPGFQSLDLALMKSWQLWDQSRLQFRAEFFNLLNHPNFDLPVGDFNNPNFGRVQSARDSRQIQFGFRLDF